MRKKFYVTRDRDGGLWLWIGFKPHKNERDQCWTDEKGCKGDLTFLPKTMFPNVKWEDEEPLEVRIMSAKAYDTILSDAAKQVLQEDEYNTYAKSSKRTKKAQKSQA